MSKTAGFFDSGIGGLPYLKYMREKAPYYCYKYIADSENFPYGVKSRDAILDIVLDIIGRFIKQENPSIIVIACNTASVIALEKLRNTYDIPFVGVVPAIKPAANISKKRRIGLFATNRTVNDAYTENLISSYANGCEVFRYADPDIVSFIETSFFDSDENTIMNSVRPAVDYFIDKKVDNIILGCTHFLYLDKYFRKMIPSSISIIDSREGVSNQALKVMDSAPETDRENCSDSFFVTSEDDSAENYRFFSDYFNLKYSGKLPK